MKEEEQENQENPAPVVKEEEEPDAKEAEPAVEGVKEEKKEKKKEKGKKEKKDKSVEEKKSQKKDKTAEESKSQKDQSPAEEAQKKTEEASISRKLKNMQRKVILLDDVEFECELDVRKVNFFFHPSYLSTFCVLNSVLLFSLLRLSSEYMELHRCTDPEYLPIFLFVSACRCVYVLLSLCPLETCQRPGVAHQSV